MNDIIESIHGQSIDLKQREIYLHGYHGPFDDDPGVEYRMATTLIKNIGTSGFLQILWLNASLGSLEIGSILFCLCLQC